MNYSYKQNKKSKVVSWLLTIILLLAAAGAIFVIFDFDNNEKEQTVDTTGTLIQEGLVMDDRAEFRLEDQIGLKFKAIISPELYNEVYGGENKSLGIAFAPLRFFEQVDTGESFENIDWIKLLQENDLAPTCIQYYPIAITKPDGTLSHYIHEASVTNFPYQGVNMKIMAIGYVKTNEGGNISYKYASLPEGVSYQEYASSYASAAADKLNELAVYGSYLAQSDIDVLRSIINQSVDLANGLQSPTDDGSRYSVTLSEETKTLSVGENFTIEVNIEESVPTSIWWQSTDSSVAVVNNGVIKAVGEGSATINVFVAGEKYTCQIIVDNRIELPDSVE